MTPFRVLTATACPLPVVNVDTDQLIPATDHHPLLPPPQRSATDDAPPC